MSVYSKAELYELWTFFAGQHDEAQMMADFALCSREEAQALIDEFEIICEAHALGKYSARTWLGIKFTCHT